MTVFKSSKACCGFVAIVLSWPSNMAFAHPSNADLKVNEVEEVVLERDEPSLPDPYEAGWRGKKICEKLIEDAQHRILRCVFPPGGGHERHHHAPHSGYVIKGGLMRITDKKGVREVDIKTGSKWTSDGVDWHEVVNIGDTTASYLIIEIKSQ